MTTHKHEHKADIWTIFGALGEGIASSMCNYSAAAMWTLLLTKDEDSAQICGIVFTVLAIPSMIARKSLFKNAQHGHSHGPAPAHSHAKDNYQLVDEHNHHHLSKWKKFALGIDFFTHSNEMPGAIVQWQSFAGLNKLSTGLLIAIQVLATSLGAIGSVAHTRRNIKAVLEEEGDFYA